MTVADPHLSCGLYSLTEAAWLLRTSRTQLQYWMGRRGGTDAMISRQFPNDAAITFVELMELHFIKLFRDHGVTLQAIRRAAAAAARKFDTRHPFTVKQFDTDGRTIFATLQSAETDRELTEDLQQGQLVFTRIVRPFFKKIDYDGTSEAARFWPLKKGGRVVLDPLRRFGQPIDDATGVPIKSILDAVHAGGGQEVSQVAKWLDIPADAVRAALRFERSLSS